MVLARRRGASPRREPSTAAHALSREDTLGDVISVEAEDIRGLSLTTLLGGFGRLFGGGGAMAREEPELVYSYSRQVETLDFFVSHSWAAGRLHKFVALVMHFNARPVHSCSLLLVTSLVLLELHCFESLPSWLLAELPDNLNLDHGMLRVKYLVMLTLSLLLPLLLLCWHRIGGSGAKRLFLDIACICQSDAAKKARGIESLGALLDRSETMVVLLDETYFTRLWCAFEVACFARRAGAERLTIIPLQRPLAEFAATLMWVLAHLAIFATLTLGPGQFRGHRLNAFIFLAIIGPLQAIVLQAFISGERAAAALAALKTFELSKCECYSDREALLRLIAKWYADPASAHLPEETQMAIGQHRCAPTSTAEAPLRRRLPTSRSPPPPHTPQVRELRASRPEAAAARRHGPGRPIARGGHPAARPVLLALVLRHGRLAAGEPRAAPPPLFSSSLLLLSRALILLPPPPLPCPRLAAGGAAEAAHAALLPDARLLRHGAAALPRPRMERTARDAAAPSRLECVARVGPRPRRRRPRQHGHVPRRLRPRHGRLDAARACWGRPRGG